MSGSGDYIDNNVGEAMVMTNTISFTTKHKTEGENLCNLKKRRY